MSGSRRIAITGIGMVTPTGLTAPATWTNLVAGKSGVDTIRGFKAGGFPVQIGAEVKDFHAADLIEGRKLLKFASRTHGFALVAAEEAMNDAGLRPTLSTATRWGCCVGAGMMGASFAEVEVVH